MSSRILDRVQIPGDELIQLRRDFHRFPELGFNEEKSAAKIISALKSYGYGLKTQIARTGIVATLGHGSPVIMLRFDMDALPIREESQHSYVSQIPGLMHACGHDGHMAVGLIAARLLAEGLKQGEGTLKFVFQPAEEGLGGAEKMLEEGVLSDPAPDYCLGMHIWNEKPLGWVGVTPGPVMAGSDSFDVKIYGVGGHGAMPQQTKDVIITASQIVASLQTIVSRNLDPLDSGVISVTTIRAGDAFNVLPSTTEMTGTIRYFDESVHQLLRNRFVEIVKGMSSTYGCTADVQFKDITPPLVNDARMTWLAYRAIKELGIFAKVDEQYRTMGSEDMAFFQKTIPGCYIFFGSSNQGKGLTFGHHHPLFDFDEEVMGKCVVALIGSVESILSESRGG